MVHKKPAPKEKDTITAPTMEKYIYEEYEKYETYEKTEEYEQVEEAEEYEEAPEPEEYEEIPEPEEVEQYEEAPEPEVVEQCEEIEHEEHEYYEEVKETLEYEEVYEVPTAIGISTCHLFVVCCPQTKLSFACLESCVLLILYLQEYTLKSFFQIRLFKL